MYILKQMIQKAYKKNNSSCTREAEAGGLEGKII